MSLSSRPSVQRGSGPRFFGSAVFITLGLSIAALLVVPATAFGQVVAPSASPGAATTVPTAAPVVVAATPTAVPAAVVLSTSSGLVGAPIAVNGSGFKPTELVDVSFGDTPIGSGPQTVSSTGTFSLALAVPDMLAGKFDITATGRNSGLTAKTTFTINQGAATLSFSVPQAAPGTSLIVMGTGFQPGETVLLTFNGPAVGSPAVADTKGSFSVTFLVPTLPAGSYDATALGETSATTVTASYPVTAAAPVATVAPTAAPAAAPTATPVPAPSGTVATAPAMAHDDRYFGQTSYRIDDDQVWGFFQQYGGLSTFGYPVSRTMSLLGCPVQMFQRQIIQVCAGQGAGLINMLDPEIFGYTQVNGSTFPAADATLKANTPPVSSPTYSADISAFVNANVPDTFNGQPVEFNQTFNALGGLTIWGAPISNPQPDPGNGNFIYQRFQRGIMHYTVGSGTQSILLADYLKAILTTQNLPPDLEQQARETRFYNQYCPGGTLWLCRPADLPGTDLTFAFVTG